jgi:DHA1 family bicyclomycin/chloramphenicol resistance-like MFS transporter
MTKARIFPLLTLLAAFPPLATDMYLPAIPLLQQHWQQPLQIVNLTLVGFFASYCVFLLVYGPLSDRFGRRRPLLCGISLFILSSLLCALSGNIFVLIIARVLQAAGAAAAATIAMAITKDVYHDEERARILAWMGVIMALAPALSPIIGGWILAWFSWPWIFVTQALVAIIAWFGVLRMQETLKTPSAIGPLQSAKIYLQLFKNKRFIGYALMVSAVVLPHFAYIAGSADIYITQLGISEQSFGNFYAINALAFMGGSLLCTRLLPRIGSRHVMTLGFVGVTLGGLVLMAQLFPGPWGLALPMSIVTFSMGLSRPPSNNLALEQVDQNAGAASSLLVFIFFTLGAFSMWLISLEWVNKIEVIGLIATSVGALILSIWLVIGFNNRRA